MGSAGEADRATEAVRMSSADRLLVLIPARNEAPRIEAVIAAVREVLPEAELVVVDDASEDSTARRAAQAGARVLGHLFHLGYGAALQTGYKYALRKGFNAVVQLDADGQHDAAELPGLLAPVREGRADVVLGSRFLARPPTYHGPLIRRIGSFLFALLASVLTRQRITDPTSGLRALSRPALEACCSDMFPTDYPDADTLVHLRRAGLHIVEVEARMRPSEGKVGMHRGFSPVYYVYKMLLSTLVVVLRGRARKED